MKVELQQLKGVMYNGEIEEFSRWQVFATGANGNRVLVGYLDPGAHQRLMILANQPVSVIRELVAKCEAITKQKVLPPYDIVEPPEIDNSAGEEEYEEDEDNQSDD
jgi:hypothetical protein